MRLVFLLILVFLSMTINYVVIKNIEFYDEKNYNNERVARGELVFYIDSD